MSSRSFGTALNILCGVVVLLFVGTLCIGVFVPLYTDEIGTKMMAARFFAEKGMLVQLVPQCGRSFVQPIPISLYPGAILYTVLYGSMGVVAIRVSGIALALTLYATLIRIAWVRLGADSRERRLHIAAAIAAALGFGVTPFVLVLSRNEQVMMLSLIAFALFPSWMATRGKTLPAQLALLAAFVVITATFLFSHAKYIFYVPFILVAAYATAPKANAKWFRAALLAEILFAVFQREAWSRATNTCDGAPFVKSVFAAIVLNPGALVASPVVFLKSGLTNVIELPLRIAHELAFRADYAGWLPRPSRGDPLPNEVVAVNSVTIVVVVVAMIGVLVVVGWSLWRAWRDELAKANRLPASMAAMLIVATLGNAFFYNLFAFYNCELTLPSIVLAVLLALPGLPAPELIRSPLRSLRKPAFAGVLLVSAVNIAVLLIQITPALLQSAKTEGTVLAESPYSVPIFGFSEEREKIRSLSSQCDIRGEDSTHLVIDDATYFAFEGLHQPLNLLYISDAVLWGNDLKGEAIKPFLKNLSSPGIIARCTYFPTALKAEAKTQNGYCCVPATAFDSRNDEKRP